MSNSSIWIEVNTSSFLSLSEIRIPSSKLYPSQGINASRIFLPNAKSPPAVDGPSAIISPFWTLSPKSIIGFWCKHIDWLDFSKFSNLWEYSFPSSSVTTIFLASTKVTVPAAFEVITAPESTATFLSSPVPT